MVSGLILQVSDSLQCFPLLLYTYRAPDGAAAPDCSPGEGGNGLHGSISDNFMGAFNGGPAVGRAPVFLMLRGGDGQMNREKNNRSGAEAGSGSATAASGQPDHSVAAVVKEISGTVAALRLDAVMALGFGLSRARAVLLVKGGLVQVNRRPVETPSYRLNQGDLISVRGRGSLELTALTGESRKGRQGLKLKKFNQ